MNLESGGERERETPNPIRIWDAFRCKKKEFQKLRKIWELLYWLGEIILQS